jgi:DNA-binding transcriptional LysR family regulator
MELGSTEAVKKTVAAGLGIALVSEHAVELEERAGVLAVRRVGDLDTRRGFFAVRRRSLPPAPLWQSFLAGVRGAPAG